MTPLERLPPFELTAVESGRRVGWPHNRGQALVLIFHNQNTLGAVRDVQKAVRTAFEDQPWLVVASIADAAAVPRFLRSTVIAFMARAYREATRYVPQGYDPADYIIILPDWDGEVTRRCGVKDVGRRATVLVADGDGVVQGRFAGRDLGAQTVAALARIQPSS